MSAPSRGRALSRAGFVALTVLQFIAVQIAADARSGMLNAKVAWRSWMTHRWPQLPKAVRAPLFAVGVSARALYRAGHYGGRTIAIGARNGAHEGVRRHHEHLELARYPKGTDGYQAVLDRIRVDRRVRREGYRAYAEQVHDSAAQCRAERAMWAKAGTLAELGEVTAQWAEGTVLYHPNGYDEGPADETSEITSALATLNRKGFVTSGSQPGMGPVVGFDARMWWQRAAVDGFTDPDTADQLEKVCATAGLIFINHGPARWRTRLKDRELVTASFVNEGDGSVPPEVSDAPYYGHTAFGAHLSKRAVKFDFDGYGTDALLRADQVTIIDPVWGRKDLLWDTLTGAFPEPPTGSHPGPTPPTAPDSPSTGAPWRPSSTSPVRRVGDVPAYPGEPTEAGDWQVTHIAADGRTVIESGMTREYAEQLVAWWRWRNDGMEGAPVTSGPMPGSQAAKEAALSEWDQGAVRGLKSLRDKGQLTDAECDETIQWIINGRPHTEDEDDSDQGSTNGLVEHHHNNGGNVMADSGLRAPIGNDVADNVTTPALRRFYQVNAERWAQVLDNVNACVTWCRETGTNTEQIVGGLTADRHDPATLSEAHAVMDAVQQTGRIAEQFATAVEQTQSAFEAAAKGLERARAAEDAHQAFAGGPAKNFDAYAAS